ncbi:hypothetical protein BCU68_13050 [Vibrio sp. 10N.286.49.B3]|uniref:HD domain-containing phosphohydrolase n=1 Tax=Vibrio sp. 10N.286.49.B3 TaxID=1880855 RepID=UPI000C857D5C|nr:HD domain-containing phosphohydrolase [Vibrio sp. 10N.286.49.B3]PMH43772.1 hypothetical protein BCU68_13050 [Vibrio sp. 10N.286.49.B3]
MVTIAKSESKIQIASITTKLSYIQDDLQVKFPHLQRVSFAFYDSSSDKLSTYAESASSHSTMNYYETRIDNTKSLCSLAEQNKPRILGNISQQVTPDSQHSRWLLEQGFNSSLTVPIFNQKQFTGFLFLDSAGSNDFEYCTDRVIKEYIDDLQEKFSLDLNIVNRILSHANERKNMASGYRSESQYHHLRLNAYIRILSQELAEHYQLGHEVIQNLMILCRLHDIGKSSLSEQQLLCRSNISNEDKNTIKQHLINGVGIIDELIDQTGSPQHFDINMLKNIITTQHEYLDGSGYPNGLSHASISIPARIMKVANIFDNLTSHRPYRQAGSVPMALIQLERLASEGKIDENCVEALREHQNELTAIIEQYPEKDVL